VIDTYDDHRMAMSMAPGGNRFRFATNERPARGLEIISNFWDDLQQAGFNIEE